MNHQSASFNLYIEKGKNESTLRNERFAKRKSTHIIWIIYVIIIRLRLRMILRLFDIMPPWNFGEKFGINQVEIVVHISFDVRGNLIESLLILVVYNRNYL